MTEIEIRKFEEIKNMLFNLLTEYKKSDTLKFFPQEYIDFYNLKFNLRKFDIDHN